jgi:hypothetical protein
MRATNIPRLRWYILGNHSLAAFSMNNNTDESNETCLLEPLQKENGHKDIGDVNMEICISHKNFSNVLLDSEFEKNTNPISNADENMDFCNYTF